MPRYFTASMKKYHPAPWIYGTDKEQCPTYIWYWMREGEYAPPRSCMEVKTRSIGKEGVSGCIYLVKRHFSWLNYEISQIVLVF